jgi:hypothetical protein
MRQRSTAQEIARLLKDHRERGQMTRRVFTDRTGFH